MHHAMYTHNVGKMVGALAKLHSPLLWQTDLMGYNPLHFVSITIHESSIAALVAAGFGSGLLDAGVDDYYGLEDVVPGPIRQAKLLRHDFLAHRVAFLADEEAKRGAGRRELDWWSGHVKRKQTDTGWTALQLMGKLDEADAIGIYCEARGRCVDKPNGKLEYKEEICDAFKRQQFTPTGCYIDLPAAYIEDNSLRWSTTAICRACECIFLHLPTSPTSPHISPHLPTPRPISVRRVGQRGRSGRSHQGGGRPDVRCWRRYRPAHKGWRHWPCDAPR